MPTQNDTDHTNIYHIERIGQRTEQPIRVVQISDMHLFANTQEALLGLQTDGSFRAVIQLIEEEQPHIDLLLTTGDIAQEASWITYQRFLNYTCRLNAPHFLTRGNHDLEQPFHDILNDNKVPAEIIIETWCCILLNSSVLNHVDGYLDENTLQYLQAALQRHQDKFILIALHHNPIAVGSAWLDQHMLKNSELLFSLIEAHSNVKAVIHGHVHQEFHHRKAGIDYIACPATSLQFKPNCHDFKLDTLNPGYRWLDLYADGRIETAVSRTKQNFAQIDYDSQGY